jgi:excinuclease ABC subunit C
VETSGSANESLLAAKLDSLPPTPGCYLFFDKSGAVLYVGKAKSLRSRVRSYFQDGSNDARYFIPILRKLAANLETVVTASEKEAAVLENELIKRHQPRFNVKLRDDKDFLCLRVDTNKPWPMLETVRRPSPDGARYYGPYHSATSARRTLHLVNKHFQLRTCSDAELQTRKRPCLQYQIKRCPAPCVKDVDRGWYAEQVRSVGLFLEGRHDELTRELQQRMREASASTEFELAAIYRDQLRAVEAVREEQRVVAVNDVDQDVVGIYREGGLVELEVLLVRSGRVSDTLSFSLKEVEIPDDEVLAAFLGQHYGNDAQAALIPDEIVVPVLPEGAEGVAEWLGERRAAATGRRVAKVPIMVPQRGPRVDLLRMANDNAAHVFREKQRASDDIEARLTELRDRLRLSTLPHRIECCDISHLGGGDTVGSIVALLDGQPDKKRYKSFNVKTKTDGDDYAAMYEVLARRFRRGRDAASAESSEPSSRDGEWDLPDLFVVDGGRGQLNVALSAARDLGLHGLSIVGLAKERETVTGEKMVDRVYLPGQKNGIPLRSTSSALFFLARARDEAHRFANHARKRLGRAKTLKSELEDVPGIGPVARKALLSTLGSMSAVRAASDAQILAIPGVTRRHLAALRKVMAEPTPTPPPVAPASDSTERRE